MKHILTAMVFMSLLYACASTGGAAGSRFDDLAKTILGGPSSVEASSFNISTDFVDERITLLRTRSEKGAEFLDQPAGMYLGNGLFIDSAGNIAVLVDRVIGIGPDFVGTSKFTTHQKHGLLGTDPNSTIQTVVYSKNQVLVDEPNGLVLGDKKYAVMTDGSEAIFMLTKVKSAGSKIESSTQFPNNLASMTWEVNGNTIKKSWFNFPFPVSIEYTQDGSKVSEKGGGLTVENNGRFVEISTSGLVGNFKYRVYRNPQTYLVIDENSNRYLSLSIGDKTATWKEGNSWGVLTPQEATFEYSLKVVP